MPPGLRSRGDDAGPAGDVVDPAERAPAGVREVEAPVELVRGVEHVADVPLGALVPPQLVRDPPALAMCTGLMSTPVT